MRNTRRDNLSEILTTEGRLIILVEGATRSRELKHEVSRGDSDQAAQGDKGGETHDARGRNVWKN
jgi:hypothetical protein